MVPGIAESSGGGTNFIQTDRLGSMKAYGGTDTAEYDAFGKVILRTGTSATQKGFAGNLGYQEDGESGYKLLGHRYYDPESGRFLSRDGSKDGRNWYCYCNNNPTKFVDSDGNHPILIIFAVVALICLADQGGIAPNEGGDYGDPMDRIKASFFPAAIVALLCACLDLDLASGGAITPQPFPPYDGGVQGTFKPIYRPAGTPVSRMGGGNGRFVAPPGQSRESLSIPPDKASEPDTLWILNRGTVFVESSVAAYYEQPGGGTQWVLPEGRRLDEYADPAPGSYVLQ